MFRPGCTGLVSRQWANAPRMGGGASIPSTTTSSTSSSPWTGQQGYLLGTAATPTNPGEPGIFPNAAQLYSNTADYPQYYPTSTYSGLTDEQNSLIGDVQNYGTGGGNTGLQGANANLTSTLSPGYTGETQSSFDASNPMISNLGAGSTLGYTSTPFSAANNYDTSTINGSPQEQQAQSVYGSSIPAESSIAAGTEVNEANPAYEQGQNYLSGVLGGSQLNPFSAPGFQNVVNGTLANVIPATSSSFINGGRADSGLAQNAETTAATNAIGSLANTNYQYEQGLQSTAEGQAANNQNMGLNATQNAASLAGQNLLGQQGIQQGAAGQATSNEGLGLNTTLGADTLGSNNLLTQQGNQLKGDVVAPSVDQAQYGDLSGALSAAGMTQANNQNQLNYNVADYNYNQALPFNMLGQYQNYVGGTGYGGATTGQSTTPYYSNTGANVLSGATGALGLANGGYSLASSLGLLGGSGALGGMTGADAGIMGMALM